MASRPSRATPADRQHDQRRPPPPGLQRAPRGGQHHAGPHQPAADPGRAQAGHRITEDPVGLLAIDIGAGMARWRARRADQPVVQHHGRQMGAETGHEPDEQRRDGGQIGGEALHVGRDDEGLGVAGVAIAELAEDPKVGAVLLQLELDRIPRRGVEETARLGHLFHCGHLRPANLPTIRRHALQHLAPSRPPVVRSPRALPPRRGHRMGRRLRSPTTSCPTPRTGHRPTDRSSSAGGSSPDWPPPCPASASAPWCAATPTATRRCWPTSPPPSTTSAAAGWCSGSGAGWQVNEHRAYGIDAGPAEGAARLAGGGLPDPDSGCSARPVPR